MLARKPHIALGVFAAFLSSSMGGCLSNEYVIPQAELARLAQLPPEQRGQRVQVVQELGERRSDAIDATQPPAPPPGYDQGAYPPPDGYPDGYVEGGPNVGVGVVIAPPLPLGPPHPHGLAGPGLRAPAPRGLPAGGPMGRAAPTPRSAPSGSKVPGKLGRGGGGKDDLVVLLAVVAVLATVGMVATEGARYDGHVAMYPWQSVHLRNDQGQEWEVPLAQLTAADAASARGARVMDDEGWGLMRLGRRPLDRKGFAFKMDVGGFRSSSYALDGDGMGFGLQLGYFPHHLVGVLGTWAFAGGSDAAGDSFRRNSFAVEAQVFPLGLWRLYLGGFGHAGIQYADDTLGGARDGTALGGGLILELGLTARLALSFRADYTSAKLRPDGGWQAAQMFTAGVSIY
jgi:hypothetical protein